MELVSAMSPELKALISRLNDAADNSELDILVSREIPLPPGFEVEVGGDLIGPFSLNDALHVADELGGRIACECGR